MPPHEPEAIVEAPLPAPARPGSRTPLARVWVRDESSLYLGDRSALNAFPTIREMSGRLRRELRRAGTGTRGWHRTEAWTNVLLMSFAIADTIDDQLLGTSYDMAQALAIAPFLRPAAWLVEGAAALSRTARAWSRRTLVRWRRDWGVAIEDFVIAVLPSHPEDDAVDRARNRLASLLDAGLPDDLKRRRPRIPGAFRRHDLTHHDVIALARKFTATFPERGRPILVLGLRTAGSYFAPVVTACLRAHGYRDVDTATIHPKLGPAPCETTRLGRCARRRGLVLILDEPLDTGMTLARALDILRRAGIAARDVVTLLPIHPARHDWTVELAGLGISDSRILRLEPAQWHKRRLLAPKSVEPLLRQYFQRRGYLAARVVESAATEEFNTRLERSGGAHFSRLKRVYEVRLVDRTGRDETRHVLAKSVGWGWLAYHAFIVATELASYLPPVLGPRDGILYTEWLPQSGLEGHVPDRDTIVRTVASYAAARARSLRLDSDPSADLSRRGYHGGLEMLGDVLARAYGSRVAAELKRGRITRELGRRSCPVPALIDGRMRREEWITWAGILLKTDFEQHGPGTFELNITDPAYDLADAILAFRLMPDEEELLIERYVKESRDGDVRDRLFLNKILAGTVAMRGALTRLTDPRATNQDREFNRRYIEAWRFLTVQTARLCGSLCLRPDPVRWSSRLAVLDLDGVVDRRIFGFPSTTAAGIEALPLLHAHGISIAVNTARAIGEVKECCEAYVMAGGVAEYGSVAWDAVGRSERVLVSADSLSQLDRVRQALVETPGVFLDEGYRYAIRAYTYRGTGTQPVSAPLVQSLLDRLGADRLAVRQTTLDTAIHAGEVDKGRGLGALLDLVGLPALDTVAIGDSEPDLPMFRIAGTSFAPANIRCPAAARTAGCRIVGASYQRGLLEAVRLLLHPDGGRCARCEAVERARPGMDTLFLQLLEMADHGRVRGLFRALLDPMAVQAFVRSE